MQCQNCGTQNNDDFKFCMKCGTQLSAPPPAPEPENLPPVTQAAPPIYPERRETQPESPAYSQPPQQLYPQPPYQPPAQNGVYPPPTSQPPQPPNYASYPPYQPPAQNGAYPPPTSQPPQPPTYASYPPPQSLPVQPSYQPPYQPPQQPASRPQPKPAVQRSPIQIPSGSVSWGPYNGLGTRHNLQTWWVVNMGDCVEVFNKKIEEKFRALGTGHLRPSREWRGQTQPGMEPRPFTLFTNGPQTLVLNANRMGKNLYVSLASYVKPQISTLKVLVLGGMVLFFLVSALALPQMMLNSGFMLQMFGNAGAGKTWLTLMSCLIGPVMVVNALALVSFAFYSLYRWITEKDLLAGLRMSPSQVGEDSLVATEKLLAGMVESALADLNETAQPAEPPTAEPAAPTQPEPLY